MFAALVPLKVRLRRSQSRRQVLVASVPCKVLTLIALREVLTLLMLMEVRVVLAPRKVLAPLMPLKVFTAPGLLKV